MSIKFKETSIAKIHEIEEEKMKIAKITELISLVDNTSIYSDVSNGAIIFASNAKTDDGTNWYRVVEGVASVTFVCNDGLTRTHKAESGEAGSAITWGDVEEHLTSKTGLPLSGGTLSDNLQIVRQVNPALTMHSNSALGFAQVWKATNSESTIEYGSYFGDFLPDNTNARINVRRNTSLESRVSFQQEDGSYYRLYGQHNITVSTSAPTSALTEGCMHMTY